MPLRVPTAAEIKALRTRLRLTQAEVARAAGVSQPLIARIENESVDARLSTFRAVLEALNRAEREEVTLRALMVAPVEMVKATDTVADAIRLMRDRNYSQLPVAAKGAPVGSLSERAVIQALATARDADAVARSAVREVMGPPFPTAAPDTTADEALRVLADQPAILVLERGKVIGIVAKADLLNMML